MSSADFFLTLDKKKYQASASANQDPTWDITQYLVPPDDPEYDERHALSHALHRWHLDRVSRKLKGHEYCWLPSLLFCSSTLQSFAILPPASSIILTLQRGAQIIANSDMEDPSEKGRAEREAMGEATAQMIRSYSTVRMPNYQRFFLGE